MVLVINIRFPLRVETDQTKQSKSTYNLLFQTSNNSFTMVQTYI